MTYITKSKDLVKIANAIRDVNDETDGIEYPNEYLSQIWLLPTDDVKFVKLVAGNISRIHDTKILEIGSYACYDCQSLAIVDFEKCMTVGDFAFVKCTALHTIRLPMCTSVAYMAFDNCVSLSEVYLPKCESVPYQGFGYCKNLSEISLPMCSYISGSAFYECNNLTSIYLLSSEYVTLSATALYRTPMSQSTYTGTFGSIYVPASMLESYKTRAGFSDYKNRLVGVDAE